ncbi:MAG: MATE family efflux transporter [Muribaculaceae bacterium]|nr:MATE family efflux transporter [Muribaculaceae bacterium]
MKWIQSRYLRISLQPRSEYSTLIRLGIPVMVTQLGIIVVSFADTVMVGRCGTRELGAAAFVNSIFTIAIVMQLGFANGLTPLIGALFSRNDKPRTSQMMRAGVLANIILSLVFTAILGVFYFFLDYLGQPPELMDLAKPYYLIVLSTLLPMALFNAFQQTSNGCTDTATPMWIIVGANILNIIGNWLLIGGEAGFPRLGLSGAGISTMIARYVAVIAIIAVYKISRRRRSYLEGWRSEAREALKPDMKRVWQTSYPVMIQSGIECFLWSFGGIVCGWFGTIQLASYQVILTISQLGFMLYMGFGVATSIRVANLTGLKDFSGVRRTTLAGLHLILVLATLSSLLFYFCTGSMAAFITPDRNVELAALPMIAPLILYQYCDAVQLTYANALRGTSEVKPLLWVAVIAYIIVGIPAMLWLAKGLDMGNVGVYYSFSIALFVASAGLYWSFRRALRSLSFHKAGQQSEN